MMRPHRVVISRTRLNVVPGILIIAGVCIIAWAMPQLTNSSPAQSIAQRRGPVSATGNPGLLQHQVEELSREVNDLSQRREALKDKLDAVSQQASQNQWLLSIILAVAGLLTLAQGLFAFFSAQNYVKQADDAVKRIDMLADDVRTKYPMFSEIEEARKAAFRRLSDLARRLDLDQNLYDASDPFTRQEFISLEAFAMTQFLSSASSDVVANLRLLGKFYADKYLSGKKHFDTDVERALYYFSLALRKSGRDFCVLNDLGWLEGRVAKPPNSSRAEELLIESARVNPNQKRALYNLGTLIFDPSDKAKLMRAREFLEKAAKTPNWERAPNEQFACHVQYNLACAYSRLSDYETDPKKKEELLNLCGKALTEAASQGGASQSTLDADLTTGDLSPFAANPAHAKQLPAIIEKFRIAWAARVKV